MSFRHTMLNFSASSSHTLASLNVPTGLPANSVESQRKLSRMLGLSDVGDMSIALPVVRPRIPKSWPVKLFINDRSNRFKDTLRVSLSFAAQPPSMMMSWPGLDSLSPDILAFSPQYIISSDSIPHFSESRTMEEGRNDADIPASRFSLRKSLLSIRRWPLFSFPVLLLSLLSKAYLTFTESFTALMKRSVVRIIRGFTANSSDDILARREDSGLSMRSFSPFRYLSRNAILPDLRLAFRLPSSPTLSLSDVLSAMYVPGAKNESTSLESWKLTERSYFSFSQAFPSLRYNDGRAFRVVMVWMSFTNSVMNRLPE